MQRTDDSTGESYATNDWRAGHRRRATTAELPTRMLAVVAVATGLVWAMAFALDAANVVALLAGFACLLTLPVAVPYVVVRAATAVLRYRER